MWFLIGFGIASVIATILGVIASWILTCSYFGSLSYNIFTGKNDEIEVVKNWWVVACVNIWNYIFRKE